ncbi:hypothetical protein JM83_1790 [Gillisia sp. Hel_I_86]|uniref:hypothetical protein n=1 Tax=Gillisia sp. Hel_I_86 TaxID=1249981 RepID=UPI00119B5251|nr:hypothetical protein [Gillisia sp. Hel_I_86]TVZ26800.1 hypothetical protein JM83_1790 [Gillisia sp. Hel_I_86]
MKVLFFVILFISIPNLFGQELSFKYLVVYNEKTDEYDKGVYSSTFIFNKDDSGDIWLNMENTPSVKLNQISNPVDGVNGDLVYTAARYLMMGKKMDLFIYDNGNIILRNLSNQKYMLFTNFNDLNSEK